MMESLNTISAEVHDDTENKKLEVTLSSCGNVKELTEAGFQLFINTTKSSNRLPFGKGRDLYESYPCFSSIMKTQADKVLALLSHLMRHAGCKANIQNKDDEDKIELMIEANDSILERVGKNLDDISGVTRHPEPQYVLNTAKEISGSWNALEKGSKIAPVQILHDILSQTKNMEKPQLYFKDKIDNNRESIFAPKIKYKHNMLKPLAILDIVDESGEITLSHPYDYELEHFKPMEEQLTAVEPKLFKPFEETPLKIVETVEDVKEMITDLKNYNEIAVDLEHHSYRSFQGFTCLLQVSTKDTDYVVDTLALRSDLQDLNEVFTNPKIVKVFHGASLDILWLQRDLGLYVVNMFDTYHAAKTLNFPRLSLAFLILRFCNVNVEKHFQLADWRIRPLPRELVEYARGDTHYLLYIYDHLKNLVIEKANGKTNLLEFVLSESTRLCLQRYEIPRWNEEGYMDLYHKSKKLFDNRQKFALKSLYEWRDRSARNHDESYGFVLPNHMMLNISEALPRETQGILACCNPVPVLVQKHLLELHQIILKAREVPFVQPVFEERVLYRSNAEHDFTNNDNKLRCPHDLNHDGEFRDDLPVLLSTETNSANNLDLKNNFELATFKPIVSVFEKSTKLRKKNEVVHKPSLLTPYQRYKLTKPFNEKKEADDAALNIVTLKQEKIIEERESTHKELVIKEELLSQPLIERVKIENAKKRKVQDSEKVSAKKVKREDSKIIENSYHETTNTQSQRWKPANKQEKFQDVEPFNYDSIDFHKYQTYRDTQLKKESKRNKKPERFRR